MKLNYVEYPTYYINTIKHHTINNIVINIINELMKYIAQIYEYFIGIVINIYCTLHTFTPNYYILKKTMTIEKKNTTIEKKNNNPNYAKLYYQKKYIDVKLNKIKKNICNNEQTNNDSDSNSDIFDQEVDFDIGGGWGWFVVLDKTN